MPQPSYDLWLLAACCLLGLLLPLLAAPLTDARGTLPWLLDLASHWQWLFLAGLLATALFGAWRERRWLLLLPAAALPWLSASPVMPTGDAGAQLRLASANVHLSATDIAPLAAWLAEAQPDVLVLLEVSPAYAEALQALPGYPYRLVHAEDSPFGIALLSRLPLSAGSVEKDDQGIAHLRARLEFAGCAPSLIAFHPMPPLTPEYRNRRDGQLRELLLSSGERPALLAGDLNATPWSSAFAGLDAHGWRRATGLAPTWPSWGAGLFGIPIDHVLASRHWQLRESQHGPDLGSDHLPVLVRLGLDSCPEAGQ